MPPKEKINFLIREIEISDLQQGFFQALSNLSDLGRIINDNKRAETILYEIKSSPFYKIFVAVSDDDQVIGSTTLLIEQKFIHNGGKVGHIEDVTTSRNYEGKGVGSGLVRTAVDFAKEKGCYKVILDCSEKNIQFYRRMGFKEHEISMRYDTMSS
jgi:glucosamine-phosphate N-acetyltransferase